MSVPQSKSDSESGFEGASSPYPETVSRRDFLERAGALASTAWLAAAWPTVLSTAAYAREARRIGAPFSVLSDAEAATLDAIAAQIIPSGGGLPGAREAGVVHFMDRAFETFVASGLDMMRGGLAEFENAVRTANPDVESFAALPHEAQTEMMALIVETPLFGTLRYLTIAGMFSDPSYGGNADKAGLLWWRRDGRAAVPQRLSHGLRPYRTAAGCADVGAGIQTNAA